MKWINAEQQVTVTIYDEEHEEHLDKVMTVEEMLDTYTNEGCPTIYYNPEQTGTGWTGIEDDYPVSIKAVLNITAETGALETQRRVRELPPMQKKGKWIIFPPFIEEICMCSNCKTKFREAYQHRDTCPSCGAKMETNNEN